MLCQTDTTILKCDYGSAWHTNTDLADLGFDLPWHDYGCIIFKGFTTESELLQYLKVLKCYKSIKMTYSTLD